MLQEQINALESRQLELRRKMASSDDHAAKCKKLDLSFAETYPGDLAEYQAANQEFNENEARIAELRAELAAEEAEEEAIPEEPQQEE